MIKCAISASGPALVGRDFCFRRRATAIQYVAEAIYLATEYMLHAEYLRAAFAMLSTRPIGSTQEYHGQ
jgi:hypothetical protein